jgi:molybdopterin adenylyltransferase
VKAKLPVAVITISDSAMAGTRPDVSGPKVVDRLEDLGYDVVSIHLLADDRPRIGAKLTAVADSGTVSAIFTTGGTGITPRDVTPEATKDVIDREIPGVGELMRSIGLKSTPTAPLSRALAGNRGKVLIVNLPGSPKGAIESLDAIVSLVPHMVDLLRGKTEHA